MKTVTCNVDIFRNGRCASNVVSFPTNVRESTQLNWLLLTHDRAGQAFAAAAEAKRAHAAYTAAIRMLEEVCQ